MAALQREDVGAAAVEPDVEDVGDHLVVVGVAVFAEEGGGILGVPGIDALLADGLDDAVVDSRVDQELAGLPVDEQRDRHAPGALAADHPVGAPLDHRAQAVAAFFGDEAGVGDGLHRDLRSVGEAQKSSSAMLSAPPSPSQRFSARVLGLKWVSGRSMAMNHCGVQR